MHEVGEKVAKMRFVYIMASRSKGAAHYSLKFHPNKVFKSAGSQVYEHLYSETYKPAVSVTSQDVRQ